MGRGKKKREQLLHNVGAVIAKKTGKNIATFVLLQNQNTLALKNLWER